MKEVYRLYGDIKYQSKAALNETCRYRLNSENEGFEGYRSSFVVDWLC